MKYAKYKDPKLNMTSVVERDDDDLDRPFLSDVRVSEWVDVTFPPRATEEVVQENLAALDAEQRELVAKHLDALQKIAEARAKLLSLTHEVTP